MLNFRSAAETVACVRSLVRSNYLDLRVVVVDNDAPGPAHDALRDALQAAGLRAGDGPEHSLRLVASGGNLGYAGGNNVGLAAAAAWRPDFCWLVNPDIRVSPDTLTLLVEGMGRAPDTAAIGPRVILGGSKPPVIWSDGGVVDAATGRTGNRSMGRPEADTPPGGLHDVDSVYGGALLLRTTALAHAGPLPEEWFLYFEETDYCRRLAGLGWRLLVEPGARVENHTATAGAVPRPHYLYYMTRNKVLFTRRYGFAEQPALAEFHASFLDPWRRRVAAAAPDWLAGFDEVVATALADADAGRFGRNPAVDDLAAPELPGAGTVGAGTVGAGSAR